MPEGANLCPACGAAVEAASPAPVSRPPLRLRPIWVLLATVCVLGGALVGVWFLAHRPAAPAPTATAPVDVSRIKERATQGDAQAQKELGDLYVKGEAVPLNYAEAAQWYRKAADQGNAGAQKMMGDLSDAGQGVPRDSVAAADWYRRAAEQGDSAAAYSQAAKFKVGRGKTANQEEALKWYRMAAAKGHVLAQYNLGSRYNEGRGVPPDALEAYKWLSLAADQGLPDAARVRDELKHHLTSEQIAEAKRRIDAFKKGTP